MEELARRLPPHNLEAEEAVLGGLLLDNDLVEEVVELVGPEDFYRSAHRKIMRAILELNAQGEPVDLVTLSDALRRRGELQEVGGAAYLAELAERVPSAANVAHYARIVRECSILRGLIHTATEIAAGGYDPGLDVDQFLDQAEQRIFAISERKVRPSFFRLRELMVQSMKTIEQLYERKEAITGVPTGFLDLDRMTAGLQPGDLVVVAGRPSMGKTAFALDVARHAAAEAQVGVAFFSLEMSKEQLVLRLLCSEARMDHSQVRSGRFPASEFPRLALAAGKLAELPIFIDDTPAMNVLELRAKARRLKRTPEARLGLVVVDYLQLMKASPLEGRKEQNREQEIASISRSLKALAKELDVPVLALSQLNRQVEQRSDKRPAVADLRESGAIEQDADVILLLYRPCVYDRNADVHAAEVIVGKQRNGPTGTVPLVFFPEFTRFESAVEEELAYAEAEDV
ncbi:MAG: replicative DNA helicase [Candidatus Binatia bacterium]|nr:MAG: replicative DNA helicase [Candidatus Binatia bacterium]